MGVAALLRFGESTGREIFQSHFLRTGGMRELLPFNMLPSPAPETWKDRKTEEKRRCHQPQNNHVDATTLWSCWYSVILVKLTLHIYISTCSNSTFVEFVFHFCNSILAILCIVKAQGVKNGVVSFEVILISVSPVQPQASFSRLT